MAWHRCSLCSLPHWTLCRDSVLTVGIDTTLVSMKLSECFALTMCPCFNAHAVLNHQVNMLRPVVDKWREEQNTVVMFVDR